MHANMKPFTAISCMIKHSREYSFHKCLLIPNVLPLKVFLLKISLYHLNVTIQYMENGITDTAIHRNFSSVLVNLFNLSALCPHIVSPQTYMNYVHIKGVIIKQLKKHKTFLWYSPFVHLMVNVDLYVS